VKTTLILALCVPGLLLNPGPSNAGIYKWVDSDGNVHFSDKPPAEAQASEVKVKINTYTSPRITASPFSGQPDEPIGSGEVILYSTSWCGYCKKARRYFQANNIAFTEYDVETSAKGRRDYAAMGGGGVPIILVGNKRLNGFSIAAFERLY